MATEAQLSANRLNAEKSGGPTSTQGKEISSQNSTTHGLSRPRQSVGNFYFLEDEDSSEYPALIDRLCTEFKPQSESEFTLVRHLAEADWLRTRALRLQDLCMQSDRHVSATEQFGLYMRYHAMHERTYYKALKQLHDLQARREAKAGAPGALVSQTQSPDPKPESTQQPPPAAAVQVVEKETAQPEIGFVSQKPIAASEAAPNTAQPSIQTANPAPATTKKTGAAPNSIPLDTAGGLENAA